MTTEPKQADEPRVEEERERPVLAGDAGRNALAAGAGLATFLLAYLLDMDTFMAVLLGLLIGARVAVEGNRTAEVAVTVALLVWAIALPTQLESGGGLIDDLNIALAYVVMALGLNIVVGFAGLLDLGYVAFFAIGAYTIGWFGSGFFADAGSGGEGIHIAVTGAAANLPGVHMNFLLVVIFAVIFTAVAGALIGLPTLRLRGDYIAIVTLAFGEIVGRVALNGDEIRLGSVPLLGGPLESLFGDGATLTNGRQGITPVDKVDLPLAEQFQALNLRPWYWLALGMVLLILFVNFRLRDSRLGRAWVAVREDEVAAASMGVPLVRTKLLAYATGAAFGGVSGAFLGSYLNTVNADQFQFSFSIFVLAMIILGGLGSIWGVVVGAIALSFINNRLIPDVLNDAPSKIGLDFDLTELSFAIFGFLLVIMMVLRPEGLLPERRRKLELAEGIGVGETASAGMPTAGETDLYEARA
jgi:branched-chain amino acid transport system permease protein